MKLRKLSQHGIAHYVVPLAVIVLVAIVGTALLLRSHAATLNYLGFANYTTASGGGSNTGTAIKTPQVFTSQDFLPGIGAQYVSDMSPGAKLYYGTFPGKLYFSQVCYYVRVFNSPKASNQVPSANITFVGLNNSLTRSLPADGKYHPVCVPSGSPSTQSNTGGQPLYSLWNRSLSAYVLAYQAVFYY